MNSPLLTATVLNGWRHFDGRKADMAAIMTFDDFHLKVCARLCERYGLKYTQIGCNRQNQG